MKPSHGRVILICASGGTWDDAEHKDFVDKLRRELFGRGYSASLFPIRAEVTRPGDGGASVELLRTLAFHNFASSISSADAEKALVYVVLGQAGSYPNRAIEGCISQRDCETLRPDLIGVVLDDPDVVWERSLSKGIDVTPGGTHEWMRAAMEDFEQLAKRASVRFVHVMLSQPRNLAALITASQELPNLIPASWNLRSRTQAVRDAQPSEQVDLFPLTVAVPIAARTSTQPAQTVATLVATGHNRLERESEIRMAVSGAFGSRFGDISEVHVEIAVRFLLERDLPLVAVARDFAHGYLTERAEKRRPLTDAEVVQILRSCEEGRIVGA